MTEPQYRSDRRVPPRALLISVAALAVPAAGAFLLPATTAEQYGALLWLLALLPAFLLAYYRGWKGVATALAAGMATLSLTQVAMSWVGRPIPDLLSGVVAAYVTISLGVGWLAELMHRDREEVEDLAFTDLLTHLPNRRHARVFLENEFAAAERGRLLSVVLFDLDHFKRYNDRYGHVAGDDALQVFAVILAQSTRRMNLSARFGGEEFLTVLAGSDVEGALVFAERIRVALKATSLERGSLTASAGVATFHPSMRSPDELLAAADHALYRAKREGRNCVRLFGRPPADAVKTDDAELVVPSSFPDPSDGEYPRESEELGRTRPPVTLLPHRVTGFGDGRRALLVEDEEQVRSLIRRYLEKEGFAVTEAEDVPEAVKVLGTEYDLVITDIRLPGVSGTELVAAVKSRWPTTQVVVITGLKDAQVAGEALSAGADRYLLKPFGMPELRAELADALARRDRVLAEQAQKTSLSNEALKRAQSAKGAVLDGLRSLIRAAEARDPFKRGHHERVATIAEQLAKAIDPDEDRLPLRSLRLGCELHDIGKLEVSDAILNKEERLTTEELDRVMQHTHTGRAILDPLLEDETVLGVVMWHHERWDGGGYPNGLAGEGIPLAARIAGLADALDAMISERAYRPARPWDEAVEEIRAGSGGQFDPAVVEAFEASLTELAAHLVGGSPDPL